MTKPLTFFVLALCVSCSQVVRAPKRANLDPLRHEVFLVAINAHAETLVLDRRCHETCSSTWSIMTGPGKREPAFMFPPEFLVEVESQVEQPTLDSATSAALSAQGWQELQALFPSKSFEKSVPCGSGWCRLTSGEAWYCEGDLCDLAASVGTNSLKRVLWRQAKGLPFAVLQLDYAGQPHIQASTLLVLNESKARLESQRAQMAYARGDFEEAIRLWHASIALDQDVPMTWYYLASAHVQQKEPEAALFALRQAVALGGRRMMDLAERDEKFTALWQEGG